MLMFFFIKNKVSSELNSSTFSCPRFTRYDAYEVSSRLGPLPADVRADVGNYVNSVANFEAIRITDRCFLVK